MWRTCDAESGADAQASYPTTHAADEEEEHEEEEEEEDDEDEESEESEEEEEPGSDEDVEPAAALMSPLERRLRKGRVLEEAAPDGSGSGGGSGRAAELGELDAVAGAAAGAAAVAASRAWQNGGDAYAEASSSSSSDPDELEEQADGEEGPLYPEPPMRSYSLPELLRAAGLEAAAAAAPDVRIDNIATCNSASAGPGSLYVCVPSADGAFDGHDWVAEAAEMGVSAVLAAAGRAVDAGPGLPVLRVEDTLSALGKLAAAFYEQPSRRARTVGFVGSYGKTTAVSPAASLARRLAHAVC